MSKIFNPQGEPAKKTPTVDPLHPGQMAEVLKAKALQAQQYHAEMVNKYKDVEIDAEFSDLLQMVSVLLDLNIALMMSEMANRTYQMRAAQAGAGQKVINIDPRRIRNPHA